MIFKKFVVILDANVLFSFRKRDILIALSLGGLIDVRWSEQILEELFKTIDEKRPHLKSSTFNYFK